MSQLTIEKTVYIIKNHLTFNKNLNEKKKKKFNIL